MKIIKQAIKLIGALLVGILVGLTIGYVIGWAMKGTTPAEFIDKLLATGLAEMGGVVLGSIVMMLVAGFLQIILHEGGHLVGGVLTGYRFVSFRILNRVLIREEQGFCLKKFSVAGTGGQCLLTPPEVPVEAVPVVLYNMGGVLMNLLTASIALALMFAVEDMPFPLLLFLLMMGITGILIGVVNGLPLSKLGLNNDGSNMLLLRKSLKARQALVALLRANARVQAGVRPKDMPAEWFDLGETDFKDTLQANVFLMRAARVMDLMQWEATWQLLKEADEHRTELMDLFVKEVDCELLFTALVLGKSEEAGRIRTKELMKYVEGFRKVMSSKERLLCAVALYMENDRQKAEEIYQALLNKQSAYLMQGEVASDLALMKYILEHPSPTPDDDATE